MIYLIGIEGDFNVIVMELLGPNIHDLRNACGSRFSMKTSLLIGLQVFRILEAISKFGLIHRDIKPENVCKGLDQNS